MNITKTDKRSRVTSLLLVLALVCTLFLPIFQVNSTAATSGYETKTGTNAYALFNSGSTSSSGTRYSSSGSYNYDTSSYNNAGYDIYVSASNNVSSSTARLGLSFTIMQEVTERATITINAYDVDEGSGERDVIYLVDENTGAKTRIDYLRGMDSQWNTSVRQANALIAAYQDFVRSAKRVDNPAVVPEIPSGAYMDTFSDGKRSVTFIYNPTDAEQKISVTLPGNGRKEVTITPFDVIPVELTK